MPVPRYMIMGKFIDRDGDCIVTELFKWCRGEEEGIRRAYHDAPLFGIRLLECWAVSIN